MNPEKPKDGTTSSGSWEMDPTKPIEVPAEPTPEMLLPEPKEDEGTEGIEPIHDAPTPKIVAEEITPSEAGSDAEKKEAKPYELTVTDSRGFLQTFRGDLNDPDFQAKKKKFFEDLHEQDN